VLKKIGDETKSPFTIEAALLPSVSGEISKTEFVCGGASPETTSLMFSSIG
jgi:hypothetical protein